MGRKKGKRGPKLKGKEMEGERPKVVETKPSKIDEGRRRVVFGAAGLTTAAVSSVMMFGNDQPGLDSSRNLAEEHDKFFEGMPVEGLEAPEFQVVNDKVDFPLPDAHRGVPDAFKDPRLKDALVKAFEKTVLRFQQGNRFLDLEGLNIVIQKFIEAHPTMYSIAPELNSFIQEMMRAPGTRTWGELVALFNKYFLPAGLFLKLESTEPGGNGLTLDLYDIGPNFHVKVDGFGRSELVPFVSLDNSRTGRPQELLKRTGVADLGMMDESGLYAFAFGDIVPSYARYMEGRFRDFGQDVPDDFGMKLARETMCHETYHVF